ncbi:MAG TPA: anti-sigma factor [Marmoricola sp.]|nr:anti-sigma factor [Marmoricola sp.]
MNATPNESVHALSGAYVVDALDETERETFEAHLPGCSDCQAEVASLREAASLMADDAALAPPSRLRDNVLADIRNVRPMPPENETNVVPLRRRPRRLVATAAAAAVAAAVGIGVVAEQPWRDDSTTTTLTATDRVLTAADAKRVSLDFDDGSSATVVHSAREGRAVLLTRDMAAPPRGKTFELWLQDDAGAMHPAGLMDTPGDNKVLLEGDASAATGVGITVEPDGGSEEPTTEPIALFDLSEADA